MTDTSQIDTSVAIFRRQGKVPRLPPLSIVRVRALRADDIPEINRPLAGRARPRLASLRASHHNLARFIARGAELEYASLMTGYTPAYISGIKSDPMFAELVAYYSAFEVDEHVDAQRRLAQLGLDAVDELQSRLTENPEGVTTNQLMALADLAIAKPAAARGAAQAAIAASPVQVNVVFGKEAPSALIEASVEQSISD